MTQTDTILDFPCQFPIKAMGRADVGLDKILLEIVRRHDVAFDRQRMRLQPSRKGKFVSVTLRVNAVSRAQLDAIYRAISACEMVLFAL